ncbi:MAG: T9SS type A sorting domain-containing protein [Bacteroidota bacterium]
MKKLIGIIALFLASASLHAQNLNVTPEVVASAGETFSNSSLYLEWTLGELMTETYAGTITLTQGFHQPELQATSVEELASSLGTITVYPNPTTGRITIEREKAGQLNLMLLDVSGRVVLQKGFSVLVSDLDLSQLSQGIYILRMSDGERSARSIRIQKL